MTDRTDDLPNLTQVLVQFIAHNHGMAQRLLAQHIADRHGYCTGCTCAQAGWHVAPAPSPSSPAAPTTANAPSTTPDPTRVDCHEGEGLTPGPAACQCLLARPGHGHRRRMDIPPISTSVPTDRGKEAPMDTATAWEQFLACEEPCGVRGEVLTSWRRSAEPPSTQSCAATGYEQSRRTRAGTIDVGDVAEPTVTSQGLPLSAWTAPVIHGARS
jgi:hypothetical protein